MRLYIELNKEAGGYTGSVRMEGRSDAAVLSDPRLGENDKVEIKGKKYKWKYLVRALIRHKKNDLSLAFDERGQTAIGACLYSEIFGKGSGLPQRDRKQLHASKEVDIRIITDDEHIARLPWVLLADKGVLLSAEGWSVSLSWTKEPADCELPPSPKILIVAPQPVGAGKTRAEEHLEELERMLSQKDPLLTRGSRLREVNTWEEFLARGVAFEPDVVYYYGHGEGDGAGDNARLLFASGEKHRLVKKPMADFALVLRKLKRSPVLVYVNCCYGDAAGFLGAGRQIGRFVPAVVTNRTVAMIRAARQQAMAFWEDVVLRGLAPHEAVSNVYRGLTDLGMSTSDIRWMTPVLHAGYGGWKANPPIPKDRTIHDPNWHVKIDRVSQYHIVAGETRLMLREGEPKSRAFVWYGKEGQGIDLFHKRLNIGLRDELPNANVYEVRPEWPFDLADEAASFRDMILEAFEVSSMAHIPARIRAETRGESGKRTLVYVRHLPVRSPKLINPKTLRTYLQWWDAHFTPILETNQFALLGVSFVVKNSSMFQKIMLKKEGMNDLFLDRTVFRLLDEMENLAKKDLNDFLHTHKINLPRDKRDEIIDRIIEMTGGHYEKTIEELKEMVERWRDYKPEPETESERDADEEYDY